MSRFRSFAAAAAFLLLVPGAARAQQWSFDVQPGERLVVEIETGGEVEIRGGAAGKVSIVAEVGGRDRDDVVIEAERDARGVRVTGKPARRMRNFSADVDLTIEVPAKFDLELDSMGGGFRIEDVEGELTGETMGGAIVLRRVRGDVELSTMGGSIEATDVDAAGKVSTMGGDVVFKNVRGGLRGSTMGGTVKIDGGDGSAWKAGQGEARSARPGEVVKISSMGGDIAVADAPNGADVSTMGGKVRVERAAGFVKASTMGGDVEIREVDGEVRASTMGGDVTVRVVGQGGDVEIESMSGDLELTLPAGFAGDFDVELTFTRNSRQDYEIRSDFPLSQRRDEEWRRDGRNAYKSIFGEGTSGDGRHKVVLRTVNGDIVIRKGG